MSEGDILHDTAGDCSDKEFLTARLPGRNGIIINICFYFQTVTNEKGINGLNNPK